MKQREGERQAEAGKAAEGERERWTGCDAGGAVMDVCSAEPGKARTIPLFWSMVESRAGFGVVVVVVVGEGGVSSVATVLFR